MMMSPTIFPGRIFFAFDADEVSLAGLAAVQTLASQHDLELVVGHVVDAQSPALDAEQRAQAMLSRATEGVGAGSAPELTVTRADDVAEGVVAAADEAGADVLALTTHDRKGLARLFSGSVTEDVVARAHMPVLSLREGQSADAEAVLSSGRILVPVAFDEHDGSVVAVAKAWAHEFSAEIDLLHVVPYPQIPVAPMAEAPFPTPGLPVSIELDGRGQKELMAVFEAAPGPAVRARALVSRGDVAEQIKISVQQRSYRMVVMGTAGKTGLVRFLLGSVAAHVLRSASCPVLLVPPTVRLSQQGDRVDKEIDAHAGRRFAHPSEVVQASWLGQEEKKQILEDWRLDVMRLLESTAEGMEPAAGEKRPARHAETLSAVENALLEVGEGEGGV